MSFITIEFVSMTSNGFPITEVIVSSVKDAYTLGTTLDNSDDIRYWRIKNLQGDLKTNYGWAPESEWKKYKQQFFKQVEFPKSSNVF